LIRKKNTFKHSVLKVKQEKEEISLL